MANKLLSMNKIRQILIFLDQGVSQRKIEKEVRVNRRTIASYLEKFRSTGLTFDGLLKLSDRDIDEILGLVKEEVMEDADPRRVHFLEHLEYHNQQLASKEGVTRLLLWEEYITNYPEGFQYSRFCDLLQEHNRASKAVMHFEYKPAEMMQVDFAGAPLHYLDTSTGELVSCPVFLAILPFSGYGYVEALVDAKLPQVVSALNKALIYIGGVPKGVKSDNMRQWVSKSSKYEPVFTEMLEQWANHNKIALFAARPYKPKDKPSVENFVRIAYMRIYAKLRNQTFYSLKELNAAIMIKLNEHHQLSFQRKSFSRYELFHNNESALLQPLPESSFFIQHYTRAKVQKNYHVVIGEDWHYYSVPFRYIGKEVRISYCMDSVEIFHNCTRIAIHVRSFRKHHFTTVREHMPEAHQSFSDEKGWDPEYYLKQAERAGQNTYDFIQKLMQSNPVIHQSYAGCAGLMRLLKAYGAARMEAACKRGLTGHRFKYTVIKNILDNNMDMIEETEQKEYRTPLHQNVRGAEAYKTN